MLLLAKQQLTGTVFMGLSAAEHQSPSIGWVSAIWWAQQPGHMCLWLCWWASVLCMCCFVFLSLLS